MICLIHSGAEKRYHECQTLCRGQNPHPNSRNELFKKFARTSACFPLIRVRNPAEIVEENLFQVNCFFWVDFFRVLCLLRVRLYSVTFFVPLDQSAAYILGLFQKKNSFFCAVWGNEEDLRGTKNTKIAPNFGPLFWGHFHYKTGLNLRVSAKMLAADQSNFFFVYFGLSRFWRTFAIL